MEVSSDMHARPPEPTGWTSQPVRGYKPRREALFPGATCEPLLHTGRTVHVWRRKLQTATTQSLDIFNVCKLSAFVSEICVSYAASRLDSLPFTA